MSAQSEKRFLQYRHMPKGYHPKYIMKFYKSGKKKTQKNKIKSAQKINI